jgi:hypothetical protein
LPPKDWVMVIKEPSGITAGVPDGTTRAGQSRMVATILRSTILLLT